MILKRALLFVLPLTLAACGGSDSPKVYSITTGTYAVSGATSAQPADECGLLPAYQDPAKRIGIVVSGTTATFNLANDPQAPADSLPRAVVNGNAIEQPTEANYTVAFGAGCVVRVHRTVTGELTGNDKTALTLSFTAATEPPTTCVAANTAFAKLPCSSSYHFLADKVP